MKEHETGFLRFLEENQRRRASALMGYGEKKRAKLLSMFAHDIKLDPRYVRTIPSTDHNSESILKILTYAGAPRECYVISDNSDWDRKLHNLELILDAVIGSGYGAFVSCIPGRLGYYEYEDMGKRFICEIKN